MYISSSPQLPLKAAATIGDALVLIREDDGYFEDDETEHDVEDELDFIVGAGCTDDVSLAVGG
jgi:hypothetical protein